MYHRILAYVQDMRQKERTAEQYCRLRQQAANALRTDGVVLPEDVERALFIESLQPTLRTEMTKHLGTGLPL